ncbi:MAG: SDR family oxidoreductase [Rhodomicrobium sp.]
MKFTVFGGQGFIGQRLVSFLLANGHDVLAPQKGMESSAIEANECCGHVIYSIGMTGDFRQRPYDTIEAEVAKHANLLRAARFDSWLYLSSTRVYSGLKESEPASEGTTLSVVPSRDSLYNLAKLLSEAVCLGHQNPTVRVARLSNVFGRGQKSATFLGAVISEILESGALEIREAPNSMKDYIGINEVCECLQSIALAGRERIYNVASGLQTSHQAIAEKLSALTGGTIAFAPGAPCRRFPPIDVSRLASEFPHRPSSLIDGLESLLPQSDNMDQRKKT